MTPIIYAIDVTACPVQPTGVGRYIYQLTRALLQYPFSSREQLLVFGRSDQRCRPELEGAAFIDCGVMSVPQRLLWEQTTLPTLCKKYGVQVLHSPNYTIPIRACCRRITTIHDLTCFLNPRRRKFIHAFFFRCMIRYSVRHADKIIAVSQNTKNDIQRVLGDDGRRIIVIHEAANPLCRPATEKEVNDLKKSMNLHQPYFLFVGTMEPSKNIPRLLRAFSVFLHSSDQPIELLLVGKRGWGTNHLISAVERGLIKGVRYTGYVDDKLLPPLYTGSLAFVYPSLYEGFGIPPLEAMACAAPVLCSSVSSLPEVVGEAALTFDPYDEAAIAHALATVARDEQLRLRLIAAGLQRVKQFSWEKTAAQAAALYRCVAKTNSHISH